MSAVSGCTPRVVLATILLSFCLAGGDALASGPRPPPSEVWFFAPNGSYAVRRDNKAGVIEVYLDERDSKPIWSAKLSKFAPSYSKTFVTLDGATIIHLRGNHSVSTRGDLALEIFRKDGTRHAFLASDLVADILCSHGGPSVSPDYLWLRQIGPVTSEHFELVTAWGRTAKIDFATGSVALSGPLEWGSAPDMRLLSWLYLRITLPALMLFGFGLFLWRWLRRRRARKAPSLRNAVLCVSLGVLIALTVTVLTLRYSDSQSWKYCYIFQYYISPGVSPGSGLVRPSDDYSGVWRQWHQNGQLKMEATYKNGKLDGRRTSWHDNGQKYDEGNYESDRPVGRATSWYADGRKRHESLWATGEHIKIVSWHIRMGRKPTR